MKVSKIGLADLDVSDCVKLKSLVQAFKVDKVRNTNIIVDLLKKIESKEIGEIKGGLAGIHKIFCLLIKDGDVKVPSNINAVLMTAKDNYELWVYNRYCEVHKQLRRLLLYHVFQVQELSMQVIMKLLQKEAQYPFSKKFQSFPYERLKSLLSTVLDRKTSNKKSLKHLQNYMSCEDFLYHTVKSLSKIVTEAEKSKTSDEKYQNNILDILDFVHIREEGEKSLTETKQFRDNGSSQVSIKLPRKDLLSNFNVIWETVLRWTLSESACKRCLVLLPEKVMIHLENPVGLTDFFITSYQRGGASALMSLHGVFILISRYNIEYPDFYTNVYAMLEPNMFQTKYRPRFFILLNKFLSSTHLPEYILFAFIKRLSRLLLVAPTSCLVLLLRFIVNLLVQHPSLRILIHNPSGIDYKTDPFDENESDLSKCQAKESSLWEVSTMLHHPVPAVCKAARFIERNLPECELDIRCHVEDNYEEVYEKCAKIKLPEVATTFVKPESLFKYPDDQMSQHWTLF